MGRSNSAAVAEALRAYLSLTFRCGGWGAASRKPDVCLQDQSANMDAYARSSFGETLFKDTLELRVLKNSVKSNLSSEK